MGRYTTDGRITSLVTNEGPFPWEMVDLVTTAQISLDSQQTSQLTCTILDPDLKLLQQGFFAEGWAIALGGLFFQIRVRESVLSGTQHALSITARSEGVCKMQAMKGALVRANISATDYVAIDAASAGLDFVGQPSPERSQIVRTAGSGQDQSAWDVAMQLGGEEGYWCYEAAGTVYFGKPSWLAANLPRYYARWRGAETTDPLTGVPLMRRSLDDSANGVTGTMNVDNDSADVFVPGVSVYLDGLASGIAPLDGVYLVSALQLDLDGKTPGQVTLTQPVDPVPSSSTASTSAPSTIPANSGQYLASYPKVAPNLALSSHGWCWPSTGDVRGSTAIGLSIYNNVGTPVVAPFAGQVTKVTNNSGNLSVRIYHGFGLSSEMTHMQTVAVQPGQQVTRAQKIGEIGAGGAANPYTHVQVFSGTTQVPPLSWLPALP